MNHKRKRAAAQMRAKASTRKTKPTTAAGPKRANAKSSREKVRAYRERMRAKGMRLVQSWVPDTTTPEFTADVHGQSVRANRRASAAIRQAWVEALTPLPRGHAATFDDIADLVGSVDGLPADLAANNDKYLRAGYGRKRHR